MSALHRGACKPPAAGAARTPGPMRYASSILDLVGQKYLGDAFQFDHGQRIHGRVLLDLLQTDAIERLLNALPPLAAARNPVHLQRALKAHPKSPLAEEVRKLIVQTK